MFHLVRHGEWMIGKFAKAPVSSAYLLNIMQQQTKMERSDDWDKWRQLWRKKKKTAAQQQQQQATTAISVGNKWFWYYILILSINMKQETSQKCAQSCNISTAAYYVTGGRPQELLAQNWLGLRNWSPQPVCPLTFSPFNVLKTPG
jgi:hypothetical protein